MRDEPAPDVINLPNSLLIALAAPLKAASRCPVCCTLQGEELFLEGLTPPYRKQALDLIRRQVRHVDLFIAVSDYCAAFMSTYLGIPEARIEVVPLGINVAGYEQPPATADGEREFRIGYFARVAPEKGLHVLADAYVRFRRQIGPGRARLEVAGYLSPAHREYLADIGRMLDSVGRAGEFTYHGEVDREGKLAFLRGLDVLSVPTTYDEPKGTFLLEAMASGVPVVQPRRGAFVEIIEKTGGGLLVAPDQPDSLAEGLYQLWRDRATRERLAAQAFRGVRAHYTIAMSADRLLAAYQAQLTRAPVFTA